MSFSWLGLNKDSTSPAATRQDSNVYIPQSPPSPNQYAAANNFAVNSTQRSPGSTRRRLSKTLRLSTSNRGPAIARRNTNKSLNLDGMSTSPLAMTFGGDASGPSAPDQTNSGAGVAAAAAAGAAAGAAAAAAATGYSVPTSPPRHGQKQRLFSLVKSPPAGSTSIFSSDPADPYDDVAETLPPQLQELYTIYKLKLKHIVKEEAAMAFDDKCRLNATKAEVLANRILLDFKADDQTNVFGKAVAHRGYGGQEHAAFAGDHFLTNVELIQQSKVFQAASQMPKGAHLHIHFNACLKPKVLLEQAQKMERMFIMSNLPLVFRDGGDVPTRNFDLCEIQFSILSIDNENPGDMFSANYKAKQTMPFSEFLDRFPTKAMGNKSAMNWLVSKLVFSEKETYDIHQTAAGAWERFNGRTRMMKGLFNYKSVYSEYTRLFLEDLLRDNIQYAEIRPNFMTTNQLLTDDGEDLVNNAGIVELIINACEKFKTEKAPKNFDGIKIIYCTPRSFQNDKVRDALAECLDFKKRWPDYIAGFDLVGEEAKGFPLRKFVPEFLQFQEDCVKAKVEIPFLFHCGETLDMGSEVDGNLVDALLLGAKRIGHGFALPRHPHILEQMKKHNVCVEVCPISNEILGLTPRVGGHAVYSLLARNLPCTVNSDNGTLFQSSLSHDFYQVFVGKADMSLFGWRQLAEWSLTHSCFSSPAAQADARERWLDAWRDFIIWLLQLYADDPVVQEELVNLAQDKRRAAQATIY